MSAPLAPPDCLRCGGRIDVYNSACCHVEDCQECLDD